MLNSRIHTRRWGVERRCDHSFLASELGPRSVVIDLGANQGEFATWVAHRFGCTVYGAEADPHLCNRLAQHSNLRILPFAIGGRNGSAILKRASGECPTLLDGAFRPEDRLEVRVLTLERLIKLSDLQQCERIDLVKVDIEGAELPMFENTPDDVLLRVAQFTVEFHDFIWPELSDRVNAVKSRLCCLGFRIIDFSRDNSDVLFLNPTLLNVGDVEDVYLRTIKYTYGLRRVARRLLRSRSGRS